MEQQTTEELAYQLWQQRGSPFGSSEIDWFQAEEQIRLQSEEPAHKSPLTTVVDAVESMWESVTGIAASVANFVSPDESSEPKKHS